MSNAQMGTRGLSAGDWVRLQRLRQSRKYYASTQTTPENSVVGSNVDLLATSKIQRPASSWVDFVASQTATYVLPSKANVYRTSIKNTQTRLCTCGSGEVTTKIAACSRCGYNHKCIN
jgi:hypothetical protein